MSSLRSLRTNWKVFTKSAYIIFKGHYTIVDSKTGETLVSDSFSASGSWFRKWATSSGNEKALPKQKKYLSTLKEPPYPSFAEMVGSTGGGAFGISESIEGEILRFASNYR